MVTTQFDVNVFVYSTLSFEQNTKFENLLENFNFSAAYYRVKLAKLTSKYTKNYEKFTQTVFTMVNK